MPKIDVATPGHAYDDMVSVSVENIDLARFESHFNQHVPSIDLPAQPSAEPDGVSEKKQPG